MLIAALVSALFYQYAWCRNETITGMYNYTFAKIVPGQALNFGNNPGVEGPEVNPNGVEWQVWGYDENNKVTYLFGGSRGGAWNVMWAFNETSGYFRYIAGDGGTEEAVVYGPMGIFSINYFPGARVMGGAFYSSARNLFYVCYGFTEFTNYFWYTDTWAFNITSTEWAWISGTDQYESPGVYNTLGVGTNGTYPGGRQSFVSAWDEETQKYYMIGGVGHALDQTYSLLADAWVFDAHTQIWTWIGGKIGLDVIPYRGAHGVFGNSTLGGIQYAAGGFDRANKLIYFYGGGQTLLDGTNDWINDVWGFNCTDGTFAYFWHSASGTSPAPSYGIEGVPSLSNQPSPRLYHSSYFDVRENALYVFGGWYWNNGFNDLWKFDFGTTIGTWTFAAGGQGSGNLPFGVVGAAYNQSYHPGATFGNAFWYNHNEETLWISCGAGEITAGGVYLISYTWKIFRRWFEFSSDRPYWYLASPHGTLNFGNIPGVEGPEVCPYGMEYAVSAYDQTNKIAYMFGGSYGGQCRNIMWAYNETSQYYRYIAGDAGLNEPIVYGPLGVYSASYFPGARSLGGAFYSSKTNLFFTCYGVIEFTNYWWYTDTWAYNLTSNEWAWISGTDQYESPGVYGTQFNGSNATYPGGRQDFVNVWDEETQNFYLIGGIGHALDQTFGLLADAWVFNADTQIWTWLAGPQAHDTAPYYGTHGVFGNSTLGGIRFGMGGLDKENKIIYFFGGYSQKDAVNADFVNNMWGFNITDGTFAYFWHSSSGVFSAGSYGTRGVPSTTNQIPSRYYGNSYFNPDDGSYMVFGGFGPAGFLNDMWKFDFGTTFGTFTWVSGETGITNIPVGQAKASYNGTYVIGATAGAISWYNEEDARFWIGPGAGVRDSTGALHLKSDTWFAYKGWFPDPILPPVTTTTTTTMTANATMTFNVTATVNQTMTTAMNTTTFVQTTIPTTAATTTTTLMKSSTKENKSTLIASKSTSHVSSETVVAAKNINESAVLSGTTNVIIGSAVAGAVVVIVAIALIVKFVTKPKSSGLTSNTMTTATATSTV